MKVVIVKPDATYKAGQEVEASGEQLAALLDNGLAVSASEYSAQQAVKANARKSVEAAVVRAKDRNAIPPKDERVLATALERLDAGKADAEVLCEYIDGMGATITASSGDMGKRITASVKDSETITSSGVRVTGISLEDASNGVIKATQPQNDLIRAGRWQEAQALAKEAATIMQQNHLKTVRAGGDFLLRDTIRAATYSDPNSQVGSLAGDLVTLRNLGYLVYKLPWIGKLTTDLSSEPAKFGQAILTRYITPPDVLTWVPGVGFTSQANQISDSGTGTTQSGGATLSTENPAGGNTVLDATNIFGIPKKSAPSTTDRTVTLNMFKATELEFPVSMLAGTIRNLFGEQIGAQTYSLAEEINKHVLGMFALPTAAKYSSGSAWGGIKTSYTKSLANWNLAGVIGVKNAMTISKIPDVGRFLLLHSFYHDKILEDSNLLSAKAILALINKDESSFNTGEIPTLFGVKPLESQLASWRTDTGALTTWTDDSVLGTTDAVGFAGNMSSGLFVSRPPQDYTTAMNQLGIPVTASIRLVTEPDSGLTVMVFSYADNGKMSLNQRVCLMYGAAQGDPRVGIVLKAV